VQRIAVRDDLAGIEVEPALPALARRAGVPRDGQRLQPAAPQRHQVLLQRIEAERVRHLEFVQRAIRTVGSHPQAAIALKGSGNNVAVANRTAVETALHRGGVGRLHCVAVL
jgi:hypothetical protein